MANETGRELADLALSDFAKKSRVGEKIKFTPTIQKPVLPVRGITARIPNERVR
jgi:hypothetical protein